MVEMREERCESGCMVPQGWGRAQPQTEGGGTGQPGKLKRHKDLINNPMRVGKKEGTWSEGGSGLIGLRLLGVLVVPSGDWEETEKLGCWFGGGWSTGFRNLSFLRRFQVSQFIPIRSQKPK